jgi:hypothetical protein
VRIRFAAIAPPLLIAAITLVSLIGILDPSTYARETANWAAQGVGQDWADLLLLVPAIALGAWWGRLDPARGRLILGGALATTVYTFAIYVFSVRFNRLFLIYCGIFGLACFALAGILLALISSSSSSRAAGPGPRDRVAGGFLIATGVLFGALWLSEIVPALVRGAPPASLTTTGLATNPVHVLDLSIVLPSFVATGVALVRGQPLARGFGAVLAGFGVLMALSIAILMIVLRGRGEDAELAVAGAMVAIAAVSLAVLVRLARAPRAPAGA